MSNRLTTAKIDRDAAFSAFVRALWAAALARNDPAESELVVELQDPPQAILRHTPTGLMALYQMDIRTGLPHWVGALDY